MRNFAEKYGRWAGAAALVAAVLGTSLPARADDDDHEWKRKRRHQPPYYVIEQQPRYYAPPRVIYSPPPVVVYPAPAYIPYEPQPPSLNINIPLR